MSAQIRFFKFQKELFELPIHKNESSMKDLHKFLDYIWKDIALRKPKPTLAAGDGLKITSTGAYASYEQGGRIVLARHHRCKILLLHELSHYIANDPPPYHGPKFFKVYKSLLTNYMPKEVSRAAIELSKTHQL